MKIKIFFGPDKAFDDYIQVNEDSYTTMNEVLLKVVERERSIIVRSENSPIETIQHEFNTIVCNRQSYSSMATHVINNVLLILKNITCNYLYLQNPPDCIVDTLKSKYEIQVVNYEYGKVEVEDLYRLKEIFKSKIIGQEKVINLLLPVINISRLQNNNKPIVIMFYGPPGVGKTETAKIISEAIYKNDEIKRFQLSMYQTNHAYKYLFGSDPQEKSLARDLLSRDTNVVLFDEFDKVHPNLYSAFYELFDEGKLVDRNYTANLNNSIFICTSNFQTKDEIEKTVGPAIFSRFTECIKFNELSKTVKKLILGKRLNESLEMLPDEEKDLLKGIENKTILDNLSEEVDNMTNSRVIKNTIDKYLSLIVLKERGIL